VGLLVYPNKEKKCKPLQKALDKSKIEIFKGTFGENNAARVASFLESDIIEAIWQDILEHLTID
jgi:hypothetical protein